MTGWGDRVHSDRVHSDRVPSDRVPRDRVLRDRVLTPGRWTWYFRMVWVSKEPSAPQESSTHNQNQ